MELNIIGIFKSAFWSIFSIWQIWVFVAIMLGAKIGLEQLNYEVDNFVIRKKFKQGEKWRSGREMIAWLQEMTPGDFEKYVAELFKNLGYSASVSGGSHDGGIDVVAEKDGRKYYIQCKRYSKKNSVGVPAIREFYGTLADKISSGKGYFITTGKFTLEAEKFAEGKPIELIDSYKLLEYIKLSGATNKEFVITPRSRKCPRCSELLIEKVGKFGSFYGCPNYPKCNFTMNR